MTAEKFWNRFQKLFEKGSGAHEAAESNWNNPREFTNQFVNRYLPDVMKDSESIITEFEYYRIDIIAYDNTRKAEAEKIAKSVGLKASDFSPYLWDLEIALEHENNHKEWLDEVVKLSHINCPLRVVIGYADPEKKDKCLSLAARVLQKKIGDDTADGQEFLLILGKSKEKAKNLCAQTYEPYIYSKSEFKKGVVRW